MALTKNSALALAKKRGDRLNIKGGFSGIMRSFDFNGLTLGDEFIIPEDFEEHVCEQKMRGKDSEGNDIWAKYIIVSTQNGEKQLFPGIFSKQVLVFEKTEPGKPLVTAKDANGNAIRKPVKGSAIDKFYEAFPDINEGMKLLAEACKKGKKIKLVSSEKVLTKAFGREALTNANVYTIDLV